MKLPTSIKWRLQLWYGLILIFVLSALGIAAYSMQRARTYHDIDDALKLRVNILTEALHPNGQRGIRRLGNPPTRRQILNDGNFLPRIETPALQGSLSESGFQLRAQDENLFGLDNPGNYYFLIISRTREILSQSSNAPKINTLAIFDTLRVKGPGAFITSNTKRETRFETRSKEIIIVGRDITPELNRLTLNSIELISIGLVVLSLGLIGGWWIADQSLKPIQDISRTAGLISASDLSQRIILSNKDRELSYLASILNATFARLEIAFNQQKQFAYDAAHELRTPVSIILTQTQAALKKDRTAEDYKETIEACLRAAQRMKRLIESLLELARFDSGQEVIRKDKININTLINDCIDLVTPVANETRIIIKNNSSDVLINADYEKISQVVINLLMNAIQYNIFNGAVDISTSVENGLCLIEIKDTGIGIEEDKIDYIFERFYRIDPSRKSGNSGLGLSICRAIVTAHAGTIKVKKLIPNGSHFIIELPQ